MKYISGHDNYSLSFITWSDVQLSCRYSLLKTYSFHNFLAVKLQVVLAAISFTAFFPCILSGQEHECWTTKALTAVLTQAVESKGADHKEDKVFFKTD